MKVVGIDIGFGDASTGVTFINTISEEIICKDLCTTDYGFDKWALSIYKKLDDFKKLTGKLDFVGIEKNFGGNRGICSLLDQAVGVIIGWCLVNRIKYKTINPAKLSAHLGIKTKLTRESRKRALMKYAKSLLGDGVTVITNIQDVVDSFCVADYVIYKYCGFTCSKFEKV